jgi:hypothetical protein
MFEYNNLYILDFRWKTMNKLLLSVLTGIVFVSSVDAQENKIPFDKVPTIANSFTPVSVSVRDGIRYEEYDTRHDGQVDTVYGFDSSGRLVRYGRDENYNGIQDREIFTVTYGEEDRRQSSGLEFSVVSEEREWNPPIVKNDMLLGVANFSDGNGIPHIVLAYDTDYDGREDVRFIYMISNELPENPFYLIGYISDLNGDGSYDDSEIFENPMFSRNR